MPGMRHLWLTTLSIALLLLSAEFASPQQQEEHTFPTKDQIDLLLTQSDRAFEMYEQSLKQEAQMGDVWEKAVAKDREVLVNARDLIARLKKSPDGFNGPAGFLLVGGLEDADRNMSLCMGQAGMQSATRGMSGDLTEGQRYLRLSQACMDTSTLLFTVSESAFNMYGEYLLAEHGMMDKAMSGLQQCADILKKSPTKKQ
jgi:hypothetical protein